MAMSKLAGPSYLAASAANIYVPPSSSYVGIVRHIHLCNVTASPATFSLYVGATGGSAAGTELFKTFSLAANSTYDYYCALRLLSTEFLTGLCVTGANTITVVVEGEESKI